MPDSPIDVPHQAPHVLAKMEDTHVKLRVTPNDDKMLSYSLAVPKTWAYSRQFGPVPGGPLVPQGIGFVTGAATLGAPVVAVTVTNVLFEIPIDTWARLTMAAEGWTVVAAQWFPGPHGLFFDEIGRAHV